MTTRFRLHARQRASECRAVAAALRDESHRRKFTRNAIRIVNTVVGVVAAVVLLAWLAVHEPQTSGLAGPGAGAALQTASTILGLIVAALLVAGTIYFTFLEPESPERSGDWADYLLMYADRIEQLLRAREADADARLEEILSLASKNLIDAEARWPVARKARANCCADGATT